MNGMYIKFYNYRVEFQMRGAGHIHGVLWVDIDEFLKMTTPSPKSEDLSQDQCSKRRTKIGSKHSSNPSSKHSSQKNSKHSSKHSSKLSSKHSSKHSSTHSSKHDSEMDELSKQSPHEGIKRAFEKLRNESLPTSDDCRLLEDFADLFITCSLKNPLIAKIVEEAVV